MALKIVFSDRNIEIHNVTQHIMLFLYVYTFIFFVAHLLT